MPRCPFPRQLLLTLTALVVLGTACMGAADGPGPAAAGGAGAGGAGAGGDDGGSAGGGGGGAAVNPLGRARCRAPDGVSASPATIEDAVALLNALPRPTSVACFVESLDRPLAINATRSTFSAQPAFAPRSPRVFVNFDRLWMSIVMDGEPSERIEFGYLEDDLRSIKGELKGPFTDLVAASAPFDRVLYQDSGTVCNGCHRYEERDESIDFASAFRSIALRPMPSSRVAVGDLADAARTCDWNVEPHRCEMLSAVFDGGDVIEREFPDMLPTFF